MIQEALKYLADQAVSAAKPDVVVIPELRQVGVRDLQTGNLALQDLPAVPRAAELRSVADLVAMAKDTAISPAPELYHDHDAIRLLIDGGNRHEMVTCPLRTSDAFATIVALEGTLASMPVADAVQLLRFKLPGCGPELLALAAALKVVDFKRTADAASVTQHGRESLGSRIEGQVLQAEKIPDTVQAALPIYAADPALRELSTVRIAIGVYLDVQRQGVKLCPLADEVQIARAHAQQSIGEWLRAQTAAVRVRVFQGRPSPA